MVLGFGRCAFGDFGWFLGVGGLGVVLMCLAFGFEFGVFWCV